MATNRIDWIDAAKGIGILLVMFGHCWLSAEYTYWLTAFHMPLFFILSGYTFSTKRPFTDFLHAKAKTLLIPYAAFALFYTVFYTLLSRTHGGGFDPVNELRLFLLQQRHTYLWFLPVLYLTNVFTYLLTKCLSGIKLVGGGIMMLIVFHALSSFGCVNLIWNLDLVPLCSFFMICGMLYKRYGADLHIESSRLFVAAIVLVAISASTSNLLLTNSKVDMWGNSYGYFPLFYIGALAGTYAVILLLKHLPSSKTLLFLGFNSLVFYGLHRLVLELLFTIISKAGIPYDGATILSVCIAMLCICITVLVLWPIAKFINVRAPWVLGKF